MPINYRRWAQIAEWSLVGVVLLANAFLFFGSDWLSKEWGVAGEALSDAGPFAQLVLVLSWAVFGPGSPILRACTVPFFVVGTHQFRVFGWTRGSPEHITSLFEAVGVLSFLVVVASRFAGNRFEKYDDQKIGIQGAQFSIRSLFVATTLIAVAIGGLELLRPRFQDAAIEFLELGPMRIPIANSAALAAESIRYGLMTAIIAGVSLASIWAVLRPGTFWMRLLVVGTLGVVAPWYACNLTGAGTATTLALIVWTLTILGLIVFTLMPLRLMNYRLVRPCKAATSGRGLSNYSRKPSHRASANPSPPTPLPEGERGEKEAAARVPISEPVS